MSERGQKLPERMDDTRFEELYAAYATDVLRMCCFYLKDRQKAEDVTQDVFVKLITSNPVLEPGKEKAWLLRVALNRCRDLWRSAWLKRVVLGSAAMERKSAPEMLNAAVERREMLEAIGKLKPDYREVILLHYYQGQEIRDIAQILGAPEGTVASRLSRGRKLLGAILKETWESSDTEE